MSTLFLVATPIGNLEDLTHRAERVLREAFLIAAEDTRTARRLLGRYGITNRVVSYNEHNAARRTPQIIETLAEGDVAVISEAGMPGISDPGYALVVATIEAGHEVSPVPGPSALVAAIAASGLPSRRFHYLGFPPRKAGERREALRAAAASGDTLVLFESPYRVRATLADALAVLGDRRVAVCRELTKRHEEIWRGTISGAIERFADPRGEFTVVIEGEPHSPVSSPTSRIGGASDAEVDELIAELRSNDASSREAIAALQRRCRLSRRDAYRLWHEAQPGHKESGT